MLDVILFILMLCVAWYIGVNEESFIGVVVSRVLKVKTVVIIGAISVFIGSFFFSDPVSQTLRERLLTQTLAQRFMLSVLLSMVLWFCIAFYKKLPVSTTASIIGSIAGASFIFKNSFNYGVLTEVALGIVISPVIGIALSFFLYKLIRKLFKGVKNFEEKESIENKAAVILFVFVFLLSISEAANDAPKAIAFFSNNFYFKLFGSIALSLGLIMGGKKIIKNVGTKLVQLSPTSALCAQIATLLVISAANYLKLPVSCSIVFISSLVGSGLAIRRRIGFRLYKELIFAWAFTLPLTFALSMLLSLI